jgi:hypothetical protein
MKQLFFFALICFALASCQNGQTSNFASDAIALDASETNGNFAVFTVHDSIKIAVPLAKVDTFYRQNKIGQTICFIYRTEFGNSVNELLTDERHRIIGVQLYMPK